MTIFDYSSQIESAKNILFKNYQATVDNIIQITPNNRRNTIFRIYQTSTTELPSSIILKVANEANNLPKHDWDEKRYLSEIVGSQFVYTELHNQKLTPSIFGWDISSRIILMEDLGQNITSLESYLLSPNYSQAKVALYKCAESLGKMQSATLGKKQDFLKFFSEICGTEKKPFNRGFENWNELLKTLKKLLPPNNMLLQELLDWKKRLLTKNQNLAYIHGDVCPINFCFNETRNTSANIIDFEFSQLSHILIDISCFRMLFPTCSLVGRIPMEILSNMENIHKEEITKVIPQYESQGIYYSNLIDACAYWLLNTLASHLKDALKAEKYWGTVTNRQRVLARLVEFTILSNQHNNLLTEFSTYSIKLFEKLKILWFDTMPDIPTYMAFR